MQRLRRESPLFQRSRLEILDQHICCFYQPAHQILTPFFPKISRDGFLVPRKNWPPETSTLVTMMAPVPHGITPTRALDFDHLGTKIGHTRSDERPGHKLSHFDHPDAG